ncbi:helix-turn-helix domain-containing protein [Nocardioides panaciterrulae]|uniref:Transcriptional regulator with XRE-family HTH domain n=1 Tax=Nocardioides panaciterrulae TaxID=661492 RepID=A0A7Y9J8V8_9ACTN|nr:helix-turn-helix transcriptional regulator [Nocardioides panaciterrulae]NYD39952.1 transcriptional regulator with XRE-family HTH domain [Nocardioides panaciterrulae]NYD43984.1 transcriptional regulator with XRE-family HTH domain [Nocardioides panaciterrulae]
MDAHERRAWGPLIREARKAQKIDQEELAQMAGTTRRTIGSIERGDTTAQTDVLKRILTALGLTQSLELDPDVRNFVAMLGPLLQRLATDERARLMPAIVELVADALQGDASAEPTPIRARRPMFSFDEADQAARDEDREKPRMGDE